MWLPEIGQTRGLPLLVQDLRNGHLVTRIKVLQEANTIAYAPERSTSRRAAMVEESVTTRIRNRARAPATSPPDMPDEADIPVDVQPETPGR